MIAGLLGKPGREPAEPRRERRRLRYFLAVAEEPIDHVVVAVWTRRPAAVQPSLSLSDLAARPSRLIPA
ncbi:hypothetical protein ABH922_001243 [Rhodococcus sp. 27YEA15]|uniref:hypothetical protein n=1 Tax=Rhodococcus sp. 27YEA15 TaxID=3156259 RepID=UPI003C799141